MRRPLALRCSQLQRYAQQRDAHAASLFRAKVRARRWKAHQFLWVDETSKDMRALQRTYGYALRGQKPIDNGGLRPRGERVSALCSFDLHGFVAWEYTNGTFNRDGFLSAAQKVIVRRQRNPASLDSLSCSRALTHVPRTLTASMAQLDQINPYPQSRSIVVLDNASIHKSLEFVQAVNARGAIVLFTPPYCWDLTPLDNGAFGSVKKWLMDRSGIIDALGWGPRQALDAAFKRAVNLTGAQHCVHNCNNHGMVYEFV